MDALKLFISHSSRLDEIESSDNPAENPNLELLLDVIKLIKQEYSDSIEVLVDKDEHGLPAGHDWEKRLNEWLAECHAAIILFSKRARENSNWVKKEATILSWRRELDTEFTLLPVCLKGQTTPDELSEDLFGTLRIDKSQCIRDAITAHDVLAGIKLALGDKETLKSKCKLTPFDKLENVISKLLIKNADSDTLQDTWESLENADKPNWPTNNNIKFSHALTSCLLRNDQECLNYFQTLINKIRPKINQQHSSEIFEYIRPLWVDTKAAGCILTARTENPQTANQFIVMNGKLLVSFTLYRYVERAWPMDICYKIIFTTTAEKKSLINEIRAHFNQSKRTKLSPEQCDERINTFNRQIVVLLPASQHDGCGLLDDYRLRKELGEKYPNVIFILDSGEQLPTLTPNNIVRVEPALDLQLELKYSIAEEDTEIFLDDFYGN